MMTVDEVKQKLGVGSSNLSWRANKNRHLQVICRCLIRSCRSWCCSFSILRKINFHYRLYCRGGINPVQEFLLLPKDLAYCCSIKICIFVNFRHQN